MAAADRRVYVRKTTGSATTVTVPASPTAHVDYIVKDARGDAAANPITVNGATIDGQSSFVIPVNYGAVTLVFNGTDWSVV